MSADVKVVEITSDLIPQIAELEKVCFAEPWGEKSLELLLGDNAIGVALVADGHVAAYAGMLTVLDEGQITNVATFPRYRRQGYARQVMETIEALAVSRGITSLSLEVRASNDNARGLYLSLGWKEAGVRKNFYRLPPEDAVVMIKDI